MTLARKSLFNNHQMMTSLSEVIAKFMKTTPSVVMSGVQKERSFFTQTYVSDLAPVYNFMARRGVSLFTLDSEQKDFDFSRYAREAKRLHRDKRMLLLYGDMVGIVDNGRVSQHKQILHLRDFVAFYMRR